MTNKQIRKQATQSGKQGKMERVPKRQRNRQSCTIRKCSARRSDSTWGVSALDTGSGSPSRSPHSGPSLSHRWELTGQWWGGKEVPTCLASFHSLWGYSSRRWGQEERTPARQKPRTDNTQKTQRQNYPTIKNGMNKRKGEGGQCNKQGTK